MLPDKVYIAIGSNLGQRLKTIEAALEILSKQVIDLQVSRVYESEPLYFRPQPYFLNCVASFKTSQTAFNLLKNLQRIENYFGRLRTRRFGPRTLDLDILLFGRQFLNRPKLIIPHPRLSERRFVLLPLLELEPYLQDPLDNQYYWKKLQSAKPALVYFYGLTGYSKNKLPFC